MLIDQGHVFLLLNNQDQEVGIIYNIHIYFLDVKDFHLALHQQEEPKLV